MTVSSKFLFGFRSSSSGRSSDHLPPSPGTLTHRRTRHGHGHGHGSRFHHRDDSDPPPPLSRIARLDHEAVRLERRSSDEHEASNRTIGVAIDIVSRSKLIRNDRLPDSVLQARARLLERLRGFSLLESSSAADFGALEVETPRDLLEANTPQIESTPYRSKKKPLRFSWEALCSQQRQVFRNLEGSSDNRESSECYICLEPFCEGDVLIRLHCLHRFHPSCLQPWIQICADCPCCRANVI